MTQRTRIKLGKTVFTAGVHNRIIEDTSGEFAKFVMMSLASHAGGDWGDVGAEDKRTNDAAIHDDNQGLQSVYHCESQPTIWIITDPGREVTTVLYPDEY
jgi:hypothetical protein